tara:strand:+ start:79 stop:588 length:510 start_codon:yes stop_codon:yes gene_type:complete
MKLKFDRFLQRFNNRLTSEESPYIKREDLKSYLQQHATLVPLGVPRTWSANLIEPGRVYLHWIKDSEIWDDENVRIQVATRNPVFGDRNQPYFCGDMQYLESSSDTSLGWSRKTFPESYADEMSVSYRTGSGEVYWNGWESPSLEVWEFPSGALNLNTPSLNYPKGDLL